MKKLRRETGEVLVNPSISDVSTGAGAGIDFLLYGFFTDAGLQPRFAKGTRSIRAVRDLLSTLRATTYSARGNSLAIALTTRASVGSMSVATAAAMRPSRPIRYLWKFQRGVSSGRSLAAHL